MHATVTLNQGQLFVSETEFKTQLEDRLGDQYPRAERIFGDYSPLLSYPVFITLMLASDKKDKVVEVLDALDDFHEDELTRTHPELRGLATSDRAVRLLKGLCQGIMS